MRQEPSNHGWEEREAKREAEEHYKRPLTWSERFAARQRARRIAGFVTWSQEDIDEWDDQYGDN